MKRIPLIAQREFMATVSNRGFLIGLFIFPALIALFLLAGPRLRSVASQPRVVGTVAVIDPTGQITPMLRSTLDAPAIEKRRRENAMRTMRGIPGGVPDAVVQRAVGRVPSLTLAERPADTDLDAEKRKLTSDDPATRLLALVVVHTDATQGAAGSAEFGTYDLYVSRGLDEDTETTLHDSLREALVAARMNVAALDPNRIEVMTRVTRPEAVVVTDAGEQSGQRRFMRFLPFMVGLLLFVGVITGGQTLMTSTVEEKSSRVVEVLLSAVSPFELMAGKLIGQLGVGLLAMSIYLGLGLLALYSFAMLGIIDPLLIVYLLVFFLITYLIFGALMMSIGAAVNEIQEAQSLMGPVMLLLILPYLLSPMIGRAPNSPLSVALSFIPPVNTIAMMTRMASDVPPPAWQVWLTLVVGIAGACAAVWFAGKVFKVGLLMHGKPPNVRTLIRWAREA
ncbi:MAG TPA: ABC transporter permease [Vicinamibacterales bacterium]|nr:ABC transporter permease [Vicinamibacterales bacterium]